mmetsp:Transcript_20890/g.37469  ORF Transcript_20890/g.37469 Transcript_20890/m.37469 type:complete len:185 (+) Transcript_20890:3-557(+)
MSSATTPEEEELPTAAEAGTTSPRNPSDGGTSKHFTQGEIVFVTLVSFIILLALVMGTYTCWRHRRKKNSQTTNPNNNGQGGDDIEMDMEISGASHDEKVKIITREFLLPPENRNRNNNSPTPRRIASTDSHRRRSTVESDGSNGDKRKRRMSHSSGTSSVSSQYKLAAIEHMNQISQAGRLDI